MTLTRRTFIGTGIAAAAAGPAIAQSAGTQVPDVYMPRMVSLTTPLPVGEIHVDPPTFALYWTLPDNRAIRYAVGIGRGDL